MGATSEVDTLVARALDELFEHDLLLLKIDANERSITGALAAHLHLLVPELDVDVEYNRIGEQALKTLSLFVPDGLEKECSVYPDIIAHRRAAQENYLVIEVKKIKLSNAYDGAVAWDLQKLTAYRIQLGYENALFIELPVGPFAQRSDVRIRAR